jgi:hypothetical protein
MSAASTRGSAGAHKNLRGVPANAPKRRSLVGATTSRPPAIGGSGPALKDPLHRGVRDLSPGRCRAYLRPNRPALPLQEWYTSDRLSAISAIWHPVVNSPVAIRFRQLRIGLGSRNHICRLANSHPHIFRLSQMPMPILKTIRGKEETAEFYEAEPTLVLFKVE